MDILSSIFQGIRMVETVVLDDSLTDVDENQNTTDKNSIVWAHTDYSVCVLMLFDKYRQGRVVCLTQ